MQYKNQTRMASFFHTPKPNKFHIEPRYGDPVKEKREKRERRIKAEMGIKDENGEYRPHIEKGDFRKGLANTKWAPNVQRRKSNSRLLIFIILLGLLVYLMLK